MHKIPLPNLGPQVLMHRLCISFLAFSLILIPAANAQSPVSPAALEHKKRGLALDNSGEYEAAIREYSAAIRLQPDYALAFHDRAVVHYRLGQYEAARRDEEKAVEHAPAAVLYRRALGVLLMRVERFDEAIEHLKLAKKFDPENLEIRHNLGVSYCRRTRQKEAAAEFQELLAMDPEWNSVRPCLAKSLRSLGQKQAAIDVLREYLKREPQDAEEWGTLGSIFRSLDDWKDAEQALAMQSSLLGHTGDQTKGMALLWLAQAYDKNGKTEEALKAHLEAIEELRPLDRFRDYLAVAESEYQQFLARHHIRVAAEPTHKAASNAVSSPTKAAAKSAKVTSLPPPAPPATVFERWQKMNVLTMELLGKSDLPGALKQAQAAVELARTFGEETEQVPRSLLILADVYTRMGDVENQEKVTKQAVEESERRLGDSAAATAQVNEQMGIFYESQKKDSRAALPYFQRALEVRTKLSGEGDPMTVAAADQLAASLHALHKTDEAIALMERHLASAEKQGAKDSFSIAGPTQYLGYLYASQGKFARAEELYRRELALEEKQFGPSSSMLYGALTSLAEVLRKQGKPEEAVGLLARKEALQKH